jgi:CRP-like cAMP-binding protein
MLSVRHNIQLNIYKFAGEACQPPRKNVLPMDQSLLFSAITRHAVLEKEEEEYLRGLLHFKKIRKRQLVLEQGETQSKLIYVTGGCLRSYSVDKNGFEHVLQFAPPGWWIADMLSLAGQQPARLNIDAIEDSEIQWINKPDFDTLMLKIPRLERYFRILGQNALATYQYRLIDHLSLPAIERYGNFCKTYPSLIRTLPQKQVASYIGVTPEFLSKMLNMPVK